MKVTLLLATLAVFGTSCVSNEQFEERMDRRSRGYEKVQERREIRLDERQERTDAWFDRAMN